MAKGAGKRRGSRKAPKKKVQLDPSMLLHAAGVTFCVIAWGYLVSAAIDFGSSARSGTSEAWLFLSVACIGAACCLFAGLMLGARLLRGLGLTAGPIKHEVPAREDDVAGSTYTSSSHSSHGSHSTHGSHGARPMNGAHGHAPQAPEARPHGGGHRRAHR